MALTEKQIDKQIKDLTAQRQELRKNKLWECPECKKRTKISKLGILVKQFYVEPYSCSGGDYWIEGDNPDYCINCPKCDKEIRLCNPLITRKDGKLVIEKEKTKAYEIAENYRYCFGKKGKRYSGRWGISGEDVWE